MGLEVVEERDSEVRSDAGKEVLVSICNGCIGENDSGAILA